MPIHKTGSACLRVAAALLFLAASAWTGAALYRAVHPLPVTVTLHRCTAAQLLPLRGVALRQELLLRGGKDTELLVRDGERVAAGGRLARLADGSTLTAPASGIFFREEADYGALSPQDVQPLSPGRVRSLLEQEPESEGDVLGRLVLDCAWYFAALAETESPPAAGSRCRLRPAGSRRFFPVRVVSAVSENGQTALLLRSVDDSADNFFLQKTEAELLLGEASGLALPADALRRDESGADYVIRLEDGALQRCAVQVLYGDGIQCLVSSADGMLQEGSRILVSGEEKIDASSQRQKG